MSGEVHEYERTLDLAEEDPKVPLLEQIATRLSNIKEYRTHIGRISQEVYEQYRIDSEVLIGHLQDTVDGLSIYLSDLKELKKRTEEETNRVRQDESDARKELRSFDVVDVDAIASDARQLEEELRALEDVEREVARVRVLYNEIRLRTEKAIRHHRKDLELVQLWSEVDRQREASEDERNSGEEKTQVLRRKKVLTTMTRSKIKEDTMPPGTTQVKKKQPNLKTKRRTSATE